jgi:hypothetical protein
MSNFTAHVSAGSTEEALERVARYLAKVPGFALTGRAAITSERHRQAAVEVTDLGGDRNDCWVVLTSYGISPGKELGSAWQSVPGVGC